MVGLVNGGLAWVGGWWGDGWMGGWGGSLKSSVGRVAVGRAGWVGWQLGGWGGNGG